jgi:hypothetical protein
MLLGIYLLFRGDSRRGVELSELTTRLWPLGFIDLDNQVTSQLNSLKLGHVLHIIGTKSVT